MTIPIIISSKLSEDSNSRVAIIATSIPRAEMEFPFWALLG
tara:strand:- start:227 stop:349 length:123 start_codon:yes stop_codon:yes gene_type:complete